MAWDSIWICTRSDLHHNICMEWNAAYWGTLLTRAYLDIAGEWRPVFGLLFSRDTVEISLSCLVLKVHMPVYVISIQDFLFCSITDFPAYSFPVNVNSSRIKSSSQVYCGPCTCLYRLEHTEGVLNCEFGQPKPAGLSVSLFHVFNGLWPP
jgi:hypothetical protein